MNKMKQRDQEGEFPGSSLRQVPDTSQKTRMCLGVVSEYLHDSLSVKVTNQKPCSY